MNKDKIILLSGPKKNWKCFPDETEIGEKLNYHTVDFDDSSWYDITIPSHWQQEREELKHYEGCVWYRCKFNYDEIAKDDLVHIFFKGVFYYTTFYLNGVKLRDHEGYFDLFYFGIHEFLRSGENVLAVKVTCYDEHNLNKKMQITGTFSHWDASDPTLNPGGIWNDVGLYKSKVFFIKELKIMTDLPRPNFAKEKILITFYSKYSDIDASIKVTISPNNFEGEEITEKRKIKVNEGNTTEEFMIEIKNPKLWWTHDYGDQNLYDVKVELILNGKVVEQTQKRTGIKSLHLDVDKKNYERWNITLNHHRIFLKGTNIPPYQKLAYCTREDIERDMNMLIKANMNIIRVHAHVDREELHDVCDEKGLLIWQDLPLQWFYKKDSFPQAKMDAKRAVIKLHHHPSQGIWCCHNEPIKFPSLFELFRLLIAIVLSIVITKGIELFWRPFVQINIVAVIINILITIGILTLISLRFNLIMTALFFYNTNRNKLDPLLYSIIKNEEAGQNIVLPFSGMTEGQILPSFNIPIMKTDIHTYPGWYAISRKGYHGILKTLKPEIRKKARFVTEYGAQAFPNFVSLKKFPEYSEYLKKVEISWENKDNLFKILSKYHRYQGFFMNRWLPYKNYNDLEAYIQDTQEYQAELIKCCTDTYRQIKYNALAGIITFLGFDCFPSVTWSFIDYYRVPKKAYFVVQKAFEKLYPFIEWTGKKFFLPGEVFQTDVYVSNDYWEPINNVKISYDFITESGEQLEFGEFRADLVEDSVLKIGSVSQLIPENPGKYILLNLKLGCTEKKYELENNYRIDVGKFKWRY